MEAKGGIMMCKLKDKWIREGIIISKLQGRLDKGGGGHYNVEMKWCMQKGALRCAIKMAGGQGRPL